MMVVVSNGKSLGNNICKMQLIGVLNGQHGVLNWDYGCVDFDGKLLVCSTGTYYILIWTLLRALWEIIMCSTGHC